MTSIKSVQRKLSYEINNMLWLVVDMHSWSKANEGSMKNVDSEEVADVVSDFDKLKFVDPKEATYQQLDLAKKAIQELVETPTVRAYALNKGYGTCRFKDSYTHHVRKRLRMHGHDRPGRHIGPPSPSQERSGFVPVEVIETSLYHCTFQFPGVQPHFHNAYAVQCSSERTMYYHEYGGLMMPYL